MSFVVALARSYFYHRLNEHLTETLRLLVEEGLKEAVAIRLKSRLGFLRLREILAVDATTLRLHPSLADAYPGAWAPQSGSAHHRGGQHMGPRPKANRDWSRVTS